MFTNKISANRHDRIAQFSLTRGRKLSLPPQDRTRYRKLMERLFKLDDPTRSNVSSMVNIFACT